MSSEYERKPESTERTHGENMQTHHRKPQTAGAESAALQQSGCSGSAHLSLSSLQVEYQCEGFLEKNRDTVYEEQINILKASQVRTRTKTRTSLTGHLLLPLYHLVSFFKIKLVLLNAQLSIIHPQSCSVQDVFVFLWMCERCERWM